MKHCLTTSILVALCSIVCSAQTIDKRHNDALSLELGKTGLIFNLNYDHKFHDKDYGFRLGAGSNFSKYFIAETFGGGGYYLHGKLRNFLELGAEIHYLDVDRVSDDQKSGEFIYPHHSIITYLASLNLGYRRYSKYNLIRIGFAPGITKEGFIPGGYASFGVAF